MSIETLSTLIALSLALIALLTNIMRAGSFIARVENLERRIAEIETLRRELVRIGQRVAHLEGITDRRSNYDDAQS